ncbi:MAG: hypothetical protein J2P24_10355, partial [Streptosporangiales bacterium]|nr:hypothetical protein [Streptosporangiales bacterium]
MTNPTSGTTAYQGQVLKYQVAYSGAATKVTLTAATSPPSTWAEKALKVTCYDKTTPPPSEGCTVKKGQPMTAEVPTATGKVGDKVTLTATASDARKTTASSGQITLTPRPSHTTSKPSSPTPTPSTSSPAPSKQPGTAGGTGSAGSASSGGSGSTGSGSGGTGSGGTGSGGTGSGGTGSGGTGSGSTGSGSTGSAGTGGSGGTGSGPAGSGG